MTIRASLDELFASLPAGLHAGAPGSGVAASHAIADVYDRALSARFTEAARAESTPLALVATGGWARRELAPYSDIDFIVLHDGDEPTAKRVTDRLLYPLWDEKLAIGHQIREPRAVARLAKTDLATATALLDARHIAGDRELAAQLGRPTDPQALVAWLATERKARHERFGASIYLLEPNLKQGIGALRDVATAAWAALATRSQLAERHAIVLADARDFLLRVRALVQLAQARRNDQLTFEIQEAIAPRMYPDAGDGDREIRAAVAPAVEALMRAYYLHARGVVQVSDRVLESARAPARKPRIAKVDDAFITINGELAVEDPKRFADHPAEIVRIFRVAVERALPVDGPTRDLAAETIARDPAPLAHDPAASRHLYDALCDLRDTGVPSVFELVHQLGILSALVPEWAPCTGRVQHDLYHVYTVDQHQLYALAMQKRLARGELATEFPLATELWREVRRPGPLLLATLLHDVGKPAGKGHAEKGAVLAAAVARRFGMDDRDVALVELLVRQHLTMSHLSQRRDLSDPDVIARFAAHVGDDETLVLLYLLTICDAVMTAPDNFSAWKGGLLTNLVERTRAHFRADDISVEIRRDDPRAKIVQLAADRGVAADVVARVIDSADPRLFVQLTPRQAARLVRLAGDPHRVSVEVHCFSMRGHSEVSIVAPDQPGVLAAIAGAFTAYRVDVLGAVLGHADLADGRRVLDLFYVRDGKRAAIPEDDPRWAKLEADLRELVSGTQSVGSLLARRRPPSGLPPRVTPAVITEVRVLDATQASIVEVFTRDRVGVLYAITRTLAELGLDIQLAKISTEGEKVADVFYVPPIPEAARADVIAQLTSALEAS